MICKDKKNLLDYCHTYGATTLLAILTIGFLSRGTMFSPDSYVYIKFALYVPFFFPLILDIMEYLFGEWYFVALRLIHAVLFVSSVHFLVNYIKKIYNFALPTVLFLFVICVNVYFINWGDYLNYILTEGLSFPLFLFFCYFKIIGKFKN